jgi:polar amino acid transport system ATP-binding protein
MRDSEAILRADSVHKRYGDLEVLRGVTFEVGRGEVKVYFRSSRACSTISTLTMAR